MEKQSSNGTQPPNEENGLVDSISSLKISAEASENLKAPETTSSSATETVTNERLPEVPKIPPKQFDVQWGKPPATTSKPTKPPSKSPKAKRKTKASQFR